MRMLFTATIIAVTIVGPTLLGSLSYTSGELRSPINATEFRDSEKLNKQALALFGQKKIREAIAVWEKAAKLAVIPELGYTANAEVLNNLGYAYYKLGRQYFPAAVENLARAMTIDPKRWTIYLNLGDLYEQMNEKAKAIENYRKVLELNPQYKYSGALRRKIGAFNKEFGVKMRSVEGKTIGSGSSESAPRDEINKVSTIYDYAFTIHPDLPEYKILLYLDQKLYAQRLDVVVPQKQTLLPGLKGNDGEDIGAECESLYQGRGVLETEDMNFEGYYDLKLLCFSGQHTNGFLFWLYAKANGKFVFSPELSDLGDPKPDPQTRTLTTYYYLGSAGTSYAVETHKFVEDRLILIDSHHFREGKEVSE